MLPGYVQFWTAVAVGCGLLFVLALAPIYVLLFLIFRRL
jgi:hypothetical protein